METTLRKINVLELFFALIVLPLLFCQGPSGPDPYVTVVSFPGELDPEYLLLEGTVEIRVDGESDFIVRKPWPERFSVTCKSGSLLTRYVSLSSAQDLWRTPRDVRVFITDVLRAGGDDTIFWPVNQSNQEGPADAR